ncbi:hypothetical protein OEV98_01000 [Caldibacillus lycopersici]|uniref:Uncharacterized protein n=1 Tax=Perspicuibacillus lycopersici TaxID=1325689 RepID=A0AAE3IU42_9BACI|nr:hypothetical protein [Perspicuibacillus lycopersici]MCU9612135.1 hypothetical protein [Perspicuibacillus lycopersici]
MQEIVTITNGKVLNNEKEAFREMNTSAVTRTDLSHWVLLLAFFLLFLEFVIRRLGLAYILSKITSLFNRNRKIKTKAINQTTNELLKKQKQKYNITKEQTGKFVIENPSEQQENQLKYLKYLIWISNKKGSALDPNYRKRKDSKQGEKNREQSTDGQQERELNREEEMNRLLNAKNRRR